MTGSIFEVLFDNDGDRGIVTKRVTGLGFDIPDARFFMGQGQTF